MDKFAQHIDKLIQKVLNEAAEEKATEVSEKLHGGQKNLDKNKNNKIDAEDFKLLRKKKETKEQFEDDDDSMEDELDIDFDEFDPRDKSWEEIKAHTGSPDYSEIDEQEMEDPKDGELDEFYFYDKDGDESMPGDYEGDEEEEEEAEELSAKEPTYVGKGLRKPKMIGSFDDEHGWFDEHDRQRHPDDMEDFEEEEFSDLDSLLARHGQNQRWFGKGDGLRMFNAYRDKFGGKPFRVRTRKNEMGENEVGEGNAFSGALANAKKDGKNSFEVDGKTYQVKESKRTNSVKEKVIFTESELINFIERLVEAEKVVDKGFKTAMNTTKKENTSAIKQVAAKMKDYMKNMGTEYEENPQSFPKGNKIMSREDFGKEVSDDKKNAYDASDAVDEYIDAFAYPGQTNLVFDEIKPDDTKIEKYLKGHSTTGNAQVDEDGNALGNVVPSEVGEKFYKNYKENLYGAEQMNASYKRQPAPVDIAGSEKSNGNLKSLKASQQIFNKLEESVENKKVISEMEKMKNLIGYNRKTQ